jgi:hypothetical protein
MKINTLFPSHTDGTATKGGVVLIKLKKHQERATSADLVLEVSYKDLNGKEHHNKQKVTFDKKSLYYGNSGIRKAILVSDYVSVMKNWLIDTRAGCNDKTKWVMQTPRAIMKRCMAYPPKHPLFPVMSTWERRSCLLKVSKGYKELFKTFRTTYMVEQKILKDDSLNKELVIIDKLLAQKTTSIDKKINSKDDWQFKQ